MILPQRKVNTFSAIRAVLRFVKTCKWGRSEWCLMFELTFRKYYKGSIEAYLRKCQHRSGLESHGGKYAPHSPRNHWETEHVRMPNYLWIRKFPLEESHADYRSISDSEQMSSIGGIVSSLMVPESNSDLVDTLEIMDGDILQLKPQVPIGSSNCFYDIHSAGLTWISPTSAI